MRYKFKELENGQIAEGGIVVSIQDGEAEVTSPEQVALAEKWGGKLVKEEPPKPEIQPEYEPEKRRPDKWQQTL